MEKSLKILTPLTNQKWAVESGVFIDVEHIHDKLITFLSLRFAVSRIYHISHEKYISKILKSLKVEMVRKIYIDILEIVHKLNFKKYIAIMLLYSIYDLILLCRFLFFWRKGANGSLPKDRLE